jgi:hypothetical protein
MHRFFDFAQNTHLKSKILAASKIAGLRLFRQRNLFIEEEEKGERNNKLCAPHMPSNLASHSDPLSRACTVARATRSC